MTEAGTASNGADGGRDPATGRFVVGNRCSVGAGNPRVSRLGELQTAVRAAATPADLRQVLDAMRAAAAGGDAVAARVWLERVLGRPREAAPDHAIELSPLDGADGCAAALSQIATAAAAGAVDVDVARELAGLVNNVINATALASIEKRLTDLEIKR